MSYRDSTKVGSGGFGTVVRTERISDGMLFAKKILIDDQNAEEVRRFKREVLIQKRLEHPNIVPVIDFNFEDPPYFYIMPLYENSLAKLIPGIVGNDAKIYPIFLSILTAIEFAHSQDVIHRDLKPDNILINGEEVVVSDFGLGLNLSGNSTRNTRTGTPIGTILYMSPEQLIDGKKATVRSDIFSLGMILYEMYSGSIQSSPPDTSAISAKIAVIVNRCTNPNPNYRYRSVADLKDAWISVFEVKNMKTDLGRLLFLRDNMFEEYSHDPDEVKELVDLLIMYIDNSTVQHEALIKLSFSAFRAIYEQDSGKALTIIESYIKFCCTNRWNFEYVDKIGDNFRIIFNAIEDPYIRAHIVGSLVKLGSQYNRYHVMNIVGEILRTLKHPRTIIETAKQLDEIDKQDLLSIAQNFDLTGMDVLLNPYFGIN
jgi:serine/threonine protein kinase